MYALFAENTETRDRKFMGGLWLSFTEMKNYIQRLVDLDTWPHGTLAIAVNLNDDMNTFAYFYDHGEWDHVGRMVHETN